MGDSDEATDRLGTHASPINLTLLHGTWGQGFLNNKTDLNKSNASRWFSPDSEFSSKLLNHLNKYGITCKITSVLWSGSNSIVARDDAAVALAQHLNSQNKETPLSKQIIIAHSHGGNVALRAKNYIDFTQNISLISLATPFVQIISKPSSIWLDIALFTFIIVSMIVFTVIPVIFIINFIDEIQNYDIPQIAFFAVIGIIVYISARLSIWIIDFALISKKLNLTKLSSISTEKNFANILVMRGNSDEAAIALFLGEIGNDIAKYSIILFHNFILIFFISIYFLVEFNVIRKISESEIGLFFLAFPAAILISITAIAIGALCKSVFGFELAFGFISHEIVGGAMPGDQPSVDTLVIADDQGRGILKHSLYENSNCVPAIANWIKIQLDGSG